MNTVFPYLAYVISPNFVIRSVTISAPAYGDWFVSSTGNRYKSSQLFPSIKSALIEGNKRLVEQRRVQEIVQYKINKRQETLNKFQYTVE